MNYQVKVMPIAAADMADQVAFISLDSHAAAANWVDGCEDAINSLEFMPQRCRLAPEAEAFDREIRQLIYHSPRILFDVLGNKVRILRVVHGARLPLTPDEEFPSQLEL